MARAEHVTDLDDDVDGDLEGDPGGERDGGLYVGQDVDSWAPAPTTRGVAALARRAVALTALLAALVLAAVGTRHATSSADSPATGSATGSAEGAVEFAPPTAEQLYPVLASAAPEGSVPLDPALATARDVVAGSARQLDAAGDVLFWVALDSGGDVCLLVRNRTGPPRLGGACTAPADAALHGVALPEGDGLSAVLLPRRLDPVGVVDPAAMQVGAGLWVVPRGSEVR